jgi:hypothetical protein
VALVVAGIVLVGRDYGGTTAPTTVPTTSVVPTTAAPTATSSVLVAGPVRFAPGSGPVLGPATTGTLWALVRGDAADEVVAVDLATGDVRRRRVGVVVDDDAQLFVTADAGALVFTAAGVEQIGPDLSIGDIRGVPPLSSVAVSPSGEVWGEPIRRPGQLLHVALRSLAVPETIELPDGAFFVGVDQAGAPWASSMAGSYAYDRATGTWRPVSTAIARGIVDGSIVVEHVCASGPCIDQVRDLGTGATHPLEAVDAVPGYFFAVALAPASGAAAALVDDGAAGVRLVAWDDAGHVVAQRPLRNPAAGHPALTFTADGSVLLYGDGTGLGVLMLAPTAPAAEGRLNGLLAGSVVVAAASSVG